MAMPRPENDERFFDILYSCRAMRRLKPDPVPEEVLLQLVEAAMQAPSSSNAQNWAFVIVREGTQKERVAALWRRTWDFYRATFARAGQRPGEDLAARERMLQAGDYMVDHMADAPAIIFVGVKPDEALDKVAASPSTLVAAFRHFGASALRLVTTRTRTAALVSGSTGYPAVQNLLLAARGLGLGAVLTTPHLFVPGQFERLLGLPPKATIVAVVPVGYPLGKFGPVKRPAASDVVSWDRYGG